MDKVYFLSKTQFLSDLSAQELSELAEDFVWEEFAQGADIITQGELHSRFYVLTHGRAEVLLTKARQNFWQVNAFTPGDAFGEISLFTAKPAPTTIRCAENCRVLVLDSEPFARMLLRWPTLYKSFIKKLSHSLQEANLVLWEAKHKEFLRSALQQNTYKDKFYGLWGSSKTSKETEAKLAELAKTKEHLLLTGERGTGRQMFAWYLHRRRFGEAAPFVVVDGRHFDHQWGDKVFSSASQEEHMPLLGALGLLDIIQDGTLLIREINLISPRAQLRLADSLSASNCLVVGSIEANSELEAQIIPELRSCLTQNFRIAPLRERKRDIPVIAQGVLQKLAEKNKRSTPVLDTEATKLLLSHNYRQGNVTELIQVIERAFFLAENNLIGLEHIFFGPTAEKIGRTINLLAWKPIEHIFKQSSVILWLQRFSTGIFLAILLLLLVAPNTDLGSSVFTLVWGLWWPALAIISPFLGRIWCTVCPFSYIMDRVQHKLHLNRPVPDLLKKYDYLFITVLFVLIFWVEAVFGMRFNPFYTVMLLISIQLAAVVVGIIFTRHTWCHHLCPLGGFVGTASIGALMEVRADATVCVNKCTTHECYKGAKETSGCPMSQHLPFVDNNLACKFCFNCVRICPNNAVAVNVRIPAREVWHLVRVNQGYVIFIATILAILLPINNLERFQSLLPNKSWLYWFSLAYWGIACSAGILTWLLIRPFKTRAASRRIKLVFAIIPLVLTGHIVYQLHFLPYANSLMVGLGLRDRTDAVQTVFVPVFRIGQVLSVIIGLLLTGFSAVMVILRSKKPQSTEAISLQSSEKISKTQ